MLGFIYISIVSFLCIHNLCKIVLPENWVLFVFIERSFMYHNHDFENIKIKIHMKYEILTILNI